MRKLGPSAAVALTLSLLGGAGDVRALPVAQVDVHALGQEKQAEEQHGAEVLKEGWRDFTDHFFILDIAIVLLCAMFLSAFIAYHPLTRGKASSIAEIEQPKTFIMYSMVGAVIAQIVKVMPGMAFVVFGIGGLLRFRTDVGEAKDTGRVILVTVVGLCCGLKLYVIAVLATLFGWLLIWYLESQSAGRMLVKGIEREAIPKAQEAYGGILNEAGCAIIGVKKNMVKGQVSFVFRAPRQLDRDSIEERFAGLPKEIRGAIDWDIS